MNEQGILDVCSDDTIQMSGDFRHLTQGTHCNNVCLDKRRFGERAIIACGTDRARPSRGSH